jgi:hypothetical protein
MDPRDHPGPLPDGAACTACGASVPTGRIRLLAHRDDLAFVELDCPGCRSSTLGLLMAPTEPDGPSTFDLADDERERHPIVARGSFEPITAADVEAMRSDLAAWDGDLVGWLDALERGGRHGPVVDR